ARQTRYPDQPVQLHVRCAAACDIRATPEGTGTLVASADASLRAAGTAHLTLQPLGHPLLSFRARSLRVKLMVAAPGGEAAVTRHVRVPVTLRHSPPVPKPLEVTVRRDGKDLVVRWRTAFAAPKVTFDVLSIGLRDSRVRHPGGRRS